jgi:hypothetical protein
VAARDEYAQYGDGLMSEQERDEIIELDMDGDGDLEQISHRDPVEMAQAYVDDTYGDTGWKVEEVASNVDFGMTTVILGRYLPSGDMVNREASAEGHGTSIPEAVDDALGKTVD